MNCWHNMKTFSTWITLFCCSVCAQQSSVETPVSQQVFLFLHIFMHVSVSYCEQCSIERCMKEQNLYRPEGKGQVWLFIGSGLLIGDITGCAFSYVLTAHFHIYFMLIFINTGCSFSYGEMPTIVSGALTAQTGPLSKYAPLRSQLPTQR